MNKKQILEKLKGNIKFENVESNSFNNVQWKAEICNRESILFYNLHDTMMAKEAFLKKVDQTNYGVIVTDNLIDEITKVSNVIVVENDFWMKAQSLICDEFYPMNSIYKIGITGTNGKTTTSDLLMKILSQNNQRAIVVGTLGVVDISGVVFETGLTSPPYIWNRKFIHDYQDYDAIIFEVSSHALVQKRFFDIRFDSGAWTSFSQDHLDYHKTMDEYFRAKSLLLDYLKDDANLYISSRETEILSKLKSKKVKMSREFNDIVQNPPLFFQSEFNEKNLENAYSLAENIIGDISVDFEKLDSTPGRFNVFEKGDVKIIIDFAHTPDALINICEGIKKVYPSSRLITIFGCGGDRDKTKRPLMGAAVSQFSDFAYLTSDNPRNEAPMNIIKDIVPGMKIEHDIIEDRAQAIKQAIDNSKSNDIILIAGKGHENYILQNGEKRDYSDEREVLKNIK
jgi:UDP-N-acetylmuramoyl-L-alanyl-D-glutamate--2,6-diaminopimelate ligase